MEANKAHRQFLLDELKRLQERNELLNKLNSHESMGQVLKDMNEAEMWLNEKSISQVKQALLDNELEEF